MKAGRILIIALGVLCLVIAAIYLVSPETIGGPLTEGTLQSQQGYGFDMPAKVVTYQFTNIPIGVGTLTVPQWSAVAIFAVLGGMFLLIGLSSQRKGGA